jgi:PBP1b-binding outer membrane lipoprotein LpoB
MIKYVTIAVMAFLMLGCGSKAEVAKPKSTPQKVLKEVVKADTTTVKTVTKTPTLPAGFVEEKKLRAIGANVPKTCQEWSDGCNTCARAANNQANCTIYTCENRGPFSCLKWQ